MSCCAACSDPAIDLDPVILEYEGVLERLARRLVETGEIASTHEGVPFGRRLSQIYLEARRVFAGHFDCTLSMVSVSADSPIWVGPDPTRSAPNVTCRNGGWRHPWGTNIRHRVTSLPLVAPNPQLIPIHVGTH